MVNFDEEKRFKLFDQAFLWLGENKMTLGDKDSGEHITMLVNKEGILDVHRTIEGSEKKYEPLLKLDLNQLGETLQNNPNIIQNFTQDLFNKLKLVTFTEPEFAECHILLVRNKEEMADLVKKVKRNVILDENTINEADFIPWPEAKDKIKEKALVLDKNNSSIGYLFKAGENVFFMDGDSMMNSYFQNLIMNMATFYNPTK